LGGLHFDLVRVEVLVGLFEVFVALPRERPAIEDLLLHPVEEG